MRTGFFVSPHRFKHCRIQRGPHLQNVAAVDAGQLVVILAEHAVVRLFAPLAVRRSADAWWSLHRRVVDISQQGLGHAAADRAGVHEQHLPERPLRAVQAAAQLAGGATTAADDASSAADVAAAVDVAGVAVGRRVAAVAPVR